MNKPSKCIIVDGSCIEPGGELASLTQPKRVAWLKEIANGRKIRAEEAWKNGAMVTRITKSKESSKIE
jgi:hypothetical protein